MDLWNLYEMMLRSRLFEEAVTKLWNAGVISGEMHLGIGEEAIVAGIIDNLEENDAMALDHRGTPPMVMRGVNLLSLMKEFMGMKEGLCGGKGGHMHLFSKEHKIVSSGILGSSGPSAAGFSLAAQYRKENSISVSFFGEGTMNQGMLMESMNLAVAWNLPVIFVCKDNKMAITTVSESVTGGSLVERAASFGMDAWEIDGSDIEACWETAKQAITHARSNSIPVYIHAHCFRRDGHFLGDPLLRLTRQPVKEISEMAGPLMKSCIKIKGAPVPDRARSLKKVVTVLGKTVKNQIVSPKDPINRAKEKLKYDKKRLEAMEQKVKEEIEWIISDCSR